MKKTLDLSLFLIMATAMFCASTNLSAENAATADIPDLTKKQVEPQGNDWYLHCGKTRGWAWRDDMGSCDQARQILITKVPVESSVRFQLKVGDVILGVNGKPFDRHPIYQFRQASLPANQTGGKFDVILWRQGWDEPKNVTLDLSYKPMDFTRGDRPGLAVDTNLGPTGARGWFQGQREESFISRQIYITEVAEGSPADGILQEGDVILGLGDQEFDSDSRRTLGRAITAAETEEGQGKLQLLRWRDGETETVTINLPIMGSYSATTPWNCEKSQRILQQACDYIIKNDILNRKGLMHGESLIGTLALMSTGDPEHMKLAKKQVDKLIKSVDEGGDEPPFWGYPSWGWGYGNLVLTEYYLLTGDERALPGIQKYSQLMAEGQSGVGSWGHGMAKPNHGPPTGYGALNQIGNICLLSLILAQECGVNSPEIERAVREGKIFLEKFVDFQPIPYGDHHRLDPTGHDDNGKCSQGAVIFALTENDKPADFYTRMTIASHGVRERGHTGNWFAMLWGPLGAARAGQPACSAFLHEQTWYHDLERTWDGGFTYQGKMGVGYGVHENGRQKNGSEHQYPHWDTTVCRILMYTLPLKRLKIAGNDVKTYSVSEEDIAMLIEAGERPPKDQQRYIEMYDDRSVSELVETLGHWSPVVRNFAASSLSQKEDVPVDTLIAMLDSDNRYATYGAASALRRLGPKASEAVEPLISKLRSDDHVLQIHAAMALGATKDPRGVDPLLELAAGEIEDDPRDLVRRYAGRALFSGSGLLRDSLEGVDREKLYAAVRRLLESKAGLTRSYVAKAVLEKLTPGEMEELWGDAIPAMREIALTEVMYASDVRLSVAQRLADDKIVEGIPLILEYMQNQNWHGSEKRTPKIARMLKQYGASAKPYLPEMEELLAYLQEDHDANLQGEARRSLKWRLRFYNNLIPHLKDVIETIRNAEDGPELISISDHVQLD